MKTSKYGCLTTPELAKELDENTEEYKSILSKIKSNELGTLNSLEGYNIPGAEGLTILCKIITDIGGCFEGSSYVNRAIEALKITLKVKAEELKGKKNAFS